MDTEQRIYYFRSRRIRVLFPCCADARPGLCWTRSGGVPAYEISDGGARLVQFVNFLKFLSHRIFRCIYIYRALDIK